MSDVGCRMSDVGCQMSDFGCQMSVVQGKLPICNDQFFHPQN